MRGSEASMQNTKNLSQRPNAHEVSRYRAVTDKKVETAAQYIDRKGFFQVKLYICLKIYQYERSTDINEKEKP